MNSYIIKTLSPSKWLSDLPLISGGFCSLPLPSATNSLWDFHINICLGVLGFLFEVKPLVFFKYPSRLFFVVSVLQVPLGMLTSLWSLEAIFSHKPTFVIQTINLHFILYSADTVESLQPSISCWFPWHFYVICCSFSFLHFYILLCCGFRLQILYQTEMFW